MIASIVAVYLAGLLLVGWWCHKTRIGGMTDFLLAGRNLGVILCASAMAATHFGGGALMGGAAYGYEHGLSGAWYGISTGLGLLLLALFTASRFRKLSLYTIPDYLATRYGGSLVRILGALLSLVALVGILAAQVNAAKSAFSITGLDPTLAAILATVVFVAYTAIGGLWAAAISDVIQIVIAAVGVILATALVWSRTAALGGMSTLLVEKGVDSTYFSVGGSGPSFILWLLLPTVMYTLIGQDFYQRLFAAKNARVARISALVGGIFLVVISFFPVIIGMGARALTDLEDPSLAVPWVLQNLMGPVLGGVILAAILAAIMSSADSLLTSATSHVVKDLWIETFNKGETVDERRMLVLARMVTVAVGAAALVIGLTTPGIVTILIYSYTMYTGGIFIPVLGGVLWSRATKAGALAAIAVGSTMALIGTATKLDLWGAPAEIYSAAASLVVFVVVSLATQPRPDQSES
ncbi:MAG: sodium:solute symporter family protein [bacterium]|nr:sodium:solute symporter family protein [bacterium]